MSRVTVNVNIDDDEIQNKLNRILSDPSVGLAIHNLLAKMCDPYVPMDEGHLAQTLEITPHYVRYTSPYAHYMYEGIVYGPNIPIIKDGVITGWFSPPGKAKHPTGKDIEYDLSKHPLASRHWDKRMMEAVGDEFIAGVRAILKAKAGEIK